MSNDLINLDSSLRHGYAQVGEVRLHYAERGSGEQLVILLHGFPECWYSWRHQLTRLGERYHVVAPDMRGYNLSDKPGSVADYRMERLIDDLLGLIGHFGARRAAVVGHDWGAAIAWAAASRYPEYCTHLAALQVPPPRAFRANMTLRQALRSWYMLFFQIPRLPEWWISARDFAALARMLKGNARRGTFTDTDITIYKAALREQGEISALTAAINYYRANFSLLHRRRSERHDPRVVGVPTLFIYGEKDMAIIPETVRDVGKYVVDAPYREVRLPRSGHWVQQESPAEVSAALESFLAGEGEERRR